MLPFSSIVIFLIFDAIIINCGVLSAFYLKFSGNIPAYNLNGYEGLYHLITLSYIIAIFISGLYRIPAQQSYFGIIRKSIKSAIIATLLSMMFNYLFRAGKASAFPVSVFIIALFINSLLITVSRFLSKSYDNNIQIYNKITAFIFNRIPEAIIICADIYISFILIFYLKSGVFLKIPDYNFNTFTGAAIIICLS